MRTWFTFSKSADTDSIYDLPTLRARSRDLVRNNPIATGAISTIRSNVVGSGLSLKARPDYAALGMTDEQADAWSETVEREFKYWSDSPECDVTRTQNFYGLQALAFRSFMESGDTFALLPFVDPQGPIPYGLRIQLVEADRVETPGGVPLGPAIAQSGSINGSDPNNRIVSGVEINTVGAPIAYHICNQHPSDPPIGDRKWTRVLAFGKTGRRNVLHVFDRTRPGQNRGIPLMAPVIEQLKQLDRYTEAELMAAVVSAMFTVFVKTEAGDGLAGDDVTTKTGQKVIDSSKEVGLGNGAILDLLPGEDVQFADPSRPNSGYSPFVDQILQQIGVALNLPFEVLIKHFTASYSAARAALLQAWQAFKQWRDFLSTSFCTPVYEAWMEEAIAMDRIDAPGFFDDTAIRRAYLGCEWIGDAPSQIDPLKEIQAANERVEAGVSDLTYETMSLTGRVWKDVHNQRKKEHQLRVEAGLEPPVLAQQLAPGGGARDAGAAGGGTQQDPANQEKGDGEKQ
jgi:lambda family phage portal protein